MAVKESCWYWSRESLGAPPSRCQLCDVSMLASSKSTESLQCNLYYPRTPTQWHTRNHFTWSYNSVDENW